ncbi:hypothetical protein [Streptomyces sp. NPDC020681]|uniref:hypothetical protein n=1 Tax=Streptomyces sp. NPDC020681 TaxID=3365083 RepID=UPI0037880F59
MAEEGPGHEPVRGADGHEWWKEEGTVRRAEAVDELRAYGAWLGRWRKQAERERTEHQLRDLYDRIYAWHQKLAQEDDQTELVLAVGLLTLREPMARPYTGIC